MSRNVTLCRFVIPALLVSISGCAAKPSLHKFEAYLGTGWHCFLTPTGFEGPGTVFRLDRNGTEFQSVVIGTSSDIQVGPISIGKVVIKQDTTFGFVAAANLNDALRVAGQPTSVSANVDASVQATRDLTVEFGGTKREVTYDAIKSQAAAWFDNHPPEPNNTYFLVREGLLAEEVSYVIDSELVASLGGTAALGNVATVSPKLKSNGDGSYTLHEKYTPPMRACIKPERLVIATVGLDGRSTYGFEPYIGDLIIRQRQ